MDDEKFDEDGPQSHFERLGTTGDKNGRTFSEESRKKYVSGLKLMKRKSGVSVGEVEEKPMKVSKNALALLRDIKSGAVDAKLLTRTQRLGCVAELLHQGMRDIEIADLFGVSSVMIFKDKQKILGEIAKIVAEFNPEKFVGWFFSQAEYHIAVAKRAGNLGLSWRVVMDMASQLTQWGLIISMDALRARVNNPNTQTIAQDPMSLLSDSELAELEAIATRHQPEEKVS